MAAFADMTVREAMDRVKIEEAGWSIIYIDPRTENKGETFRSHLSLITYKNGGCLEVAGGDIIYHVISHHPSFSTKYRPTILFVFMLLADRRVQMAFARKKFAPFRFNLDVFRSTAFAL